MGYFILFVLIVMIAAFFAISVFRVDPAVSFFVKIYIFSNLREYLREDQLNIKEGLKHHRELLSENPSRETYSKVHKIFHSLNLQANHINHKMLVKEAVSKHLGEILI